MPGGPSGFVFVSAEMRDAFRREWRAIDHRFPALSDAPDDMALAEHWGNIALLRQAAREELRRAVRLAASQGFQGIYAIPV